VAPRDQPGEESDALAINARSTYPMEVQQDGPGPDYVGKTQPGSGLTVYAAADSAGGTVKKSTFTVVSRLSENRTLT
jgi:hypothetical protein